MVSATSLRPSSWRMLSIPLERVGMISTNPRLSKLPLTLFDRMQKVIIESSRFEYVVNVGVPPNGSSFLVDPTGMRLGTMLFLGRTCPIESVEPDQVAIMDVMALSIPSSKFEMMLTRGKDGGSYSSEATSVKYTYETLSPGSTLWL